MISFVLLQAVVSDIQFDYKSAWYVVPSEDDSCQVEIASALFCLERTKKSLSLCRMHSVRVADWLCKVLVLASLPACMAVHGSAWTPAHINHNVC